jgi:hypothetical protein
MCFKDANNTCLYLEKKFPQFSAEESALIPLVRYQIYYIKQKINTAENTSGTIKCREPQQKIIPLLIGSNVHLPLRGGNLQQSNTLLQ